MLSVEAGRAAGGLFGLSRSEAAMTQQNSLITSLSPIARADVEARLKPFSAKSGTVLHRLGERVRHVYFPDSGMVSLLVVMRNGNSIEAGAAGHSSAVGMMNAISGRDTHYTSIVELDMGGHRIEAEDFRELYDQHDAVREMVRVAADIALEQAHQLAGCHAIHNTEQRLARWLLQASDCVGNKIAITQERIASLLCVQRTTLSIIANEFKKKGFIRYARGKVVIQDRDAVERLSCECYKESVWPCSQQIVIRTHEAMAEHRLV